MNALKCWALWMFPGFFDVSIINFCEEPHHLNNFLQSLNSELQRLSVTFQELLLIVNILISLCSLKQDYS